MNLSSTFDVEIRHAHLFCGLGGGARGFNQGEARIGQMAAKFRCIGGIDVDPRAIGSFDRLAGVKGTVLDLFDTAQYLAFHGKAPPADWREATTADIHAAFGHERPHIVFLSAPCKGFSGLLNETKSGTAKYQALNGLTLRGVWLMLEAYAGDPPELVIFENVPRIETRGRHLLNQIKALLESYGYAVAETKHDCGEIGGLAQTRKRFLMVARHRAKVPNFLYEPVKQRLRGVGEVLDLLPLPGDERAGPMHRVPSLQWQTWVRLAFVEAGKDWRSLNRLRVEGGMLADYAIAPAGGWREGAYGVNGWEDHAGAITSQRSPGQGYFSVADPRDGSKPHRGVLGVTDWDDRAGTVTGNGRPLSGPFSVADPRIDGHERSVQLGVRPWSEPAACVKGDMSVGTGPYAVSDPRHHGPAKHNNVFRIVRYDAISPAVAGPGGPGGGLGVADPRPQAGWGKYAVTRFDQAANTVISGSTTGQGAFALADPRHHGPAKHSNEFAVGPWDSAARPVTSAHGSGQCVADPRPQAFRDGRKHYQTGGHYGVVPWDGSTLAISGSACHDNGFNSVADPRPIDPRGDAACLPAPTERLVCRIIAEDGTWHRPFTTFELGGLQSLYDPEDWMSFVGALCGRSDAENREQIGNAVPSKAAREIAGVFGRTLLMAWSGETMTLCAEPIWVRPVALALAVQPQPFLTMESF